MIIPRAAETAIATTLSTVPICDDLHHCRSIPSIVFSCASTIFLCTWVAVHPDVPEEQEEPEEAWWKKLFKRQAFWEVVDVWVRELPRRRIMLMVSALLAPEAILTWAFLQWMSCCKDLKLTLNRNPTCTWKETHAMLVKMDGLEMVFEGYGPLRSNTLPDYSPDILMPTETQVEDRGKGDYVSKTITLIQTLWFAIQVAQRVSQGLDVTKLELTTLGHVVLNALIYWCWWNKPLCVGFPVEVHRKERGGTGNEGEEWDRGVVQGEEAAQHKERANESKDTGLSFRVRLGVYIAQSGFGDGIDAHGWSRRRLVTLCAVWVVGGVFGMIHCLAWNSTFATRAENIIWRVCALVVTVTPGFAATAGILLAEVMALMGRRSDRGEIIGPVEGFFLMIYCVSRICLLVLAFMALRDLPYSALESPSWSIYIPHIA